MSFLAEIQNGKTLKKTDKIESGHDTSSVLKPLLQEPLGGGGGLMDEIKRRNAKDNLRSLPKSSEVDAPPPSLQKPSTPKSLIDEGQRLPESISKQQNETTKQASGGFLAEIQRRQGHASTSDFNPPPLPVPPNPGARKLTMSMLKHNSLESQNVTSSTRRPPAPPPVVRNAPPIPTISRPTIGASKQDSLVSQPTNTRNVPTLPPTVTAPPISHRTPPKEKRVTSGGIIGMIQYLQVQAPQSADIFRSALPNSQSVDLLQKVEATSDAASLIRVLATVDIFLVGHALKLHFKMLKEPIVPRHLNLAQVVSSGNMENVASQVALSLESMQDEDKYKLAILAQLLYYTSNGSFSMMAYSKLDGSIFK